MPTLAVAQTIVREALATARQSNFRPLAVVVLELLRDYGRKRGVPVLVNVHTIEHARRYADRVIGLSRGRLVHDGPAKELSDEVVQAIYEGRA